jgi:anti-sigma factor RsiW
MTHLTAHQILQTVDGTADYATQAAVTSHVAVCAACRREMEFQKALLRNARRSPLPQVSETFTRSVMSHVMPRSQRPLAAWVLNNMGSLFAMMAVLGIFWLVLSQPVSFAGAQGTTEGDRMVDTWRRGLTEGYAWLENGVKALAAPRISERGAEGDDGGAAKLSLIIMSLGALWTLDRLWLSRHRIRSKH